MIRLLLLKIFVFRCSDLKQNDPLGGIPCLHFPLQKKRKNFWSKSWQAVSSKVYFLSKQSNDRSSANNWKIFVIALAKAFPSQAWARLEKSELCSAPKSLFITVHWEVCLEGLRLTFDSLESAWNNENCPLDTQKWLKLNLLPLLRLSTLTIRSLFVECFANLM